MSFLMAPVRWIVGAFVSILPSLKTDLLIRVVRFALQVLFDRADVDREAVGRLVQALRDLRPEEEGFEEDLADFIADLNSTDTPEMLEDDVGTVAAPVEVRP